MTRYNFLIKLIIIIYLLRRERQNSNILTIIFGYIKFFTILKSSIIIIKINIKSNVRYKLF